MNGETVKFSITGFVNKGYFKKSYNMVNLANVLTFY